MSEYKTCSQCKQFLPYDNFGKITKSSTGRRSACNKCRSIESKAYREKYPDKKKNADRLYRLNNLDKVRQTKKIYRQKNAEYIALWQKAYREQNKKAIAEHKREWRRKNADWADNASKKWQENNKELVKKYKQISRERHPERDKNYYLNNPAIIQSNRIKRRLRLSNAKKFKITNKDIKKIMNKPCIYCGAKAEHLDHVLPLAKGGLHSIGNLAASCAKCNLSKGAKFVAEWRYF